MDVLRFDWKELKSWTIIGVEKFLSVLRLKFQIAILLLLEASREIWNFNLDLSKF